MDYIKMVLRALKPQELKRGYRFIKLVGADAQREIFLLLHSTKLLPSSTQTSDPAVGPTVRPTDHHNRHQTY